jgi:hypothetical protein
MKSAELATAVLEVCMDAYARITHEGHDSYATGEMEVQVLGDSVKTVVGEERQRFEEESLDDDLRGLEEELLDTINWAAMSVIKLRQARARIEGRIDTTSS